MKDVVTKAALTPARKRLIELMQEIRYGRIERLLIRDGEPVFDPPPAVLRMFLLGRENAAHAARGSDDFTLKKKTMELFGIFDRERSLTIQELIIENGLPVRMTVAGGVGF